MSNVLIAYFSRKGENYVSGGIVELPVGNTEIAAQLLQSVTGGELYQIEPADAYPNDYHECTKRAQAEQRGDARPALASPPPDVSSYDTIYLGYPNYWGTMPMPVFTFLESLNLSGKTILPFCTHEGSGLGGSERDLRRLCPQSKVGKGLAIKGSEAKRALAAIESWVEKQA